jgi:hypothetical protein
MKLTDVLDAAKKEAHCGMCRIDYLDTGVCPSGKSRGFLAYWPEGRVELARALAEKTVQPTEALLDIVKTCTLCGFCDRQCHFITQLRPMKVAEGLKDYAATLKPSDLKRIPEDQLLKDLRAIVGKEWATNDPNIIVAYNRSIMRPNANASFYIAMPRTTEEIIAIVKLANDHKIPYLPRGNGTFFSVTMNTLLSDAVSIEQGIIIDLFRMKDIQIDPVALTATIQPGVCSFELQKAASKHKLRANVAEAESTVIANAQNLGIITTWSNTYGWSTDNVIEAEKIDKEGNVTHLSDLEVSNPYATERGLTSLQLIPDVIVTSLTVKLHPIFDDEENIFIPFEKLEDAIDFAENLAKRNIGLSLAVLSRKYLTEFISPTYEVAQNFDLVAKKYLKLNYIVDVICTGNDQKYIEEIAPVTFDRKMVKSLILGSAKLASMKDSSLLKMISEEEHPLKALFGGPLRKHLEKGLAASPKELAAVYDPDLREFFEKVYSRPNITDSIWLHMFRILPCRMERKHFWMYRGGYMPGDKKTILRVAKALDDSATKYGIEGAFGFLSYLEHGKFAHLEYDYYYDHTDPEARKRVNRAIVDSWKSQFSIPGVTPLEFICNKGLRRKEHILYPLAEGLSEEELPLVDDIVESVFGGEEKW